MMSREFLHDSAERQLAADKASRKQDRFHDRIWALFLLLFGAVIGYFLKH